VCGNSCAPVAPLETRLQQDAERLLFSKLIGADEDVSDAPGIFIVGAPRTGSTLFYQATASYLKLPYFSNLANNLFPHCPVLIAPAHRQLQGTFAIEFTSAYGKTEGAFQPSEASAVMRHWFGGEHPSQLKSTTILPGKEDHCRRTLAALHLYFGAPVVTKNAWNCFRIASIARLLPRAYFLWIRRDLVQSALSDLAARYVVQGDPTVWNSATPANVDELRKLPYWAQVVENQYEFHKAILSGLKEHAPGRHADVWHEDFLRDPAGVLQFLARKMSATVPAIGPEPLLLGKAVRSRRPYPESDELSLRRFVDEHRERFQALRFDKVRHAA
jgi:hypothetical protein